MVVRWLLGLLLLLPLAASAQSVGSSGPDVNARNVFATQNIQGLVPVASSSATSCTLGITSGGCSGLAHGDCGTIITFTNASPVTVTAPQTLPAGCQVTLVQGTPSTTITVGGSGNAVVNAVTGFTATSSVANAQITATVTSNTNGSLAVLNVTGDLGNTTVGQLAPTLAGQYNVYGQPVQVADIAEIDYQSNLIGERLIFPAAFDKKWLVSVRHFQVDGHGYSSGTCGQYDLQLQGDTGGVNGMPNGVSLTAAGPITFVGNLCNSGTSSEAAYQTVTFPTPYQVSSGVTYWFVTKNHTNDTSNWASLDFIYNCCDTSKLTNFTDNPLWGGVRQLQAARCFGPQTFQCTPWTDRQGFLSVVDVAFSDTNGGPVTVHWGDAYLNNGYNTPIAVNGTNQAAMIFTVSGSQNFNFNGLGYAASRVSGSANLTATLKDITAGGTTVASNTTTVPSVSTGHATLAYNQQWGSITSGFSGTLTAGHQYRLIFSTTGGTTYNFYPIENGVLSGGFAGDTQTVFSDGNSQISTNSGASFSNYDHSGTSSNWGVLTFYFTIGG